MTPTPEIPQPEVRQLRYFLAVAETLHFTRAAKKLGMAQPPLSYQIRKLEALLGYALFERTTRGVKMTRAGEVLAERARNTLGKLAEDVEQVRRVGSGEEGTLTVGFSGSIMLTGLPFAIGEYRRRRPRVALRLRELVTADQIAALLDGTIDLGFLRDGEATAGLTLTNIAHERYVAVLPAKHKAARARKFHLEALRDDDFVLFARRHGNLAFDRTVACCEERGFRPRIVQDAPQWLTVARLVAAGIGVSLAPACVERLALPGVVFRPFRSASVSSIDLAIKAGAESTLAAQFAEIAGKALRSTGSGR